MRNRYEALIKHLAKLWDNSSCTKFDRKGCAESHIAQLKKSQDVNYLPKLYREFMYEFGIDSGGLMDVSKFTFKYAINFKNHWCAEIIPSEAFIFMSDLENFAYYFLTEAKKDDPLIYLISENPENGQLMLSEHILFSEFITGWIDDVIENC